MEQKPIVLKEEPDAIEDLIQTLAVYEKNIQNCTPEELNGKYKKAFSRLVKRLEEDLKAYLFEEIFGFLYWGRDPYCPAALQKAQEIIREMEVGKRASKAIKELNIDAVVEVAQEARHHVIYDAWYPYQQKLIEAGL